MGAIESILSLIGIDRIYFTPRTLGSMKGMSLNAGKGFHCWINVPKNEGEYDEVMTLFHELLHDHELFVNRHLSHEDPEVERDIDREAVRILAERPEIFEYLLAKLREAKAFQIKESCKKIWVNYIKEVAYVARKTR